MTFLLRFPFSWGVVPDAVSTTTAVATVATRWTNLANTAKAWNEGISTPHRFERIYAMPTSKFGLSVNFAFRVASQFPFIVKTGNQIYLTSAISTP